MEVVKDSGLDCVMRRIEEDIYDEKGKPETPDM